MDPQLRRLGQALARAEQPQLEAFDLETQRSRFLLHALQRPHRSRSHFGRMAGAALLAAVLVAAVIWLRPRQIKFELAQKHGQAGEWIAAPALATLPLAFSDGSELLLRPKARARVVETSERGARIVLERGSLHAQVAHRADTRWRVDAGPFEVHVVGTQFDVAWEDERFTLTLQEGAVRVVGPTIRQGRTVRAGEHFAVTVAPPAQVTSLADPKRVVSQPARSAQSPERAEPAPIRQAPAVQPASAPTSWRRLAGEGAYEEAFHALEWEGFDRVISHVGPADLKVVADLARFSHHPNHANSALSALRARFPNTHEASDASFLLGRLAFDQRAAPAEAAGWFAAYLDEQPDGAFTREASGRLIECYERLADLPRARRAAERYLAAHPTGPHQAIAKAVLARTNADGGESP
jgi:TolA-binding protein